MVPVRPLSYAFAACSVVACLTGVMVSELCLRNREIYQIALSAHGDAFPKQEASEQLPENPSAHSLKRIRHLISGPQYLPSALQHHTSRYLSRNFSEEDLSRTRAKLMKMITITNAIDLSLFQDLINDITHWGSDQKLQDTTLTLHRIQDTLLQISTEQQALAALRAEEKSWRSSLSALRNDLADTLGLATPPPWSEEAQDIPVDRLLYSSGYLAGLPTLPGLRDNFESFETLLSELTSSSPQTELLQTKKRVEELSLSLQTLQTQCRTLLSSIQENEKNQKKKTLQVENERLALLKTQKNLEDSLDSFEFHALAQHILTKGQVNPFDIAQFFQRISEQK
jgi:hypothetical protein